MPRGPRVCFECKQKFALHEARLEQMGADILSSDVRGMYTRIRNKQMDARTHARVVATCEQHKEKRIGIIRCYSDTWETLFAPEHFPVVYGLLRPCIFLVLSCRELSFSINKTPLV